MHERRWNMPSEDVLVKWADRLEWAATWAGHASNFNTSEDCRCINELAAALRAERERVADLWSTKFVFCTYCGQRYDYDENAPVSTEDAIKAHIETCPKHPMSALKARVAELEPDAKLGRMVREMPVEQRLIHTVYGDWWYGRNVRGEFGATGASPEAVLEAARKEEP